MPTKTKQHTLTETQISLDFNWNCINSEWQQWVRRAVFNRNIIGATYMILSFLVATFKNEKERILMIYLA